MNFFLKDITEGLLLTFYRLNLFLLFTHLKNKIKILKKWLEHPKRFSLNEHWTHFQSRFLNCFGSREKFAVSLAPPTHFLVGNEKFPFYLSRCAAGKFERILKDLKGGFLWGFEMKIAVMEKLVRWMENLKFLIILMNFWIFFY